MRITVPPMTTDQRTGPFVAIPCPLCGARRTVEEVKYAECSTCKRDTWEDQGGVNLFDQWKRQIVRENGTLTRAE